MMTIEDIKEVLHSRPNKHSSWSNIDPDTIIQRGAESNETENSPNLRTNRSTTTAAGISPILNELPVSASRPLNIHRMDPRQPSLSPQRGPLSQDIKNTLNVDLLIEDSSVKFYASPYFYFPSRHSSIAQQIGSYLEVIEPLSVPIRIPLPHRISAVTTRHALHEIGRKNYLCNAMASEQITNDHCNDCDENGVGNGNSNGGENGDDKDGIDGDNGIDRDIGSDDCLVEDHSEITISKVVDQENVLPIVLIEEEEQDSAVSRPVLLTGIALKEIAGGYPIPDKSRGPIIKTLESAAKFADHCSRANKYKTVEHLDILTGILLYF
jgi:hypothetical protein